MQLIQQKMDRGNKSILIMELEALSSSSPTKTKGKLAQETRLKESLENGKVGEILSSTKSKKDHTKTSTERVNVEVPLCPRR